MMKPEDPVPAPRAQPVAEHPISSRTRFWPIVFLLAAFWGYQDAEMATHVRFFSQIGVSLLLMIYNSLTHPGNADSIVFPGRDQYSRVQGPLRSSRRP